MLKQILFFFFIAAQVQFARAGISVLNGLSHIYKVAGGQVIKGSVQIQNTGSSPQDVKIYLQDYGYAADGSTQYTAPLTNKRSNAGWIKANTNLITLKGNEKTEVFYEITVPQNIADAGTYWSVLMIEPTAEIQPNKQAGVHITNVVRYAVQLITNFQPENAKPVLKFESVKIDKENGKRILKLAIANTGNLYSRPTASVEIFDQKTGGKLGSFQSVAMGLLPNTSKTFAIDINALAPGKYSAAVLASDEDDNAFAMNIELEAKE